MEKNGRDVREHKSRDINFTESNVNRINKSILQVYIHDRHKFNHV